jgi:AraC-like DNA-binding protein
MSLVTLSPSHALAVVAWVAAAQFIEANFITPLVVGSKVSMNPMVAMLALLCGELLWGIPGLILALPLTAVMKVIFDSVLPMIDSGEYRVNRHSSAILVQRAIDVCEPVSGPVGISELSTTLNASPRTLQLAFQKVMGTTPHNFFHRRRMTKARMALLKADSRESRVTDIANHHGFSELGRFSVQYRELFGESPKVTLRRNLTSTVAIPFP